MTDKFDWNSITADCKKMYEDNIKSGLWKESTDPDYWWELMDDAFTYCKEKYNHVIELMIIIALYWFYRKQKETLTKRNIKLVQSNEKHQLHVYIVEATRDIHIGSWINNGKEWKYIQNEEPKTGPFAGIGNSVTMTEMEYMIKEIKKRKTIEICKCSHEKHRHGKTTGNTEFCCYYIGEEDRFCPCDKYVEKKK